MTTPNSKRGLHVRRLAMFFGADGARPHDGLIDIVNSVPLSWESHCRDIIQSRSALDLHLISANFNLKDSSDPGTPERNGVGWGLPHALAALARRRAHDAWDNELPLAWELRFPEDQVVHHTPDALRSYGLLRSLAAQPRKGEGLPECIWREFQEDHGRFPNVLKDQWMQKSANFIFKHDLAHRILRFQERSRGDDIRAAVTRLLPIWRTRLLSAVTHRKFRVAVDETKTLLKQISVKRLDQEPERPYSLPIADSHGQVRWRLDLFSIFADLARPAAQPGRFFLEPIEYARTVTTLPTNPPSTINEWVERLMDGQSGGQRSPLSLFRKAISAVKDQRGEGLQRAFDGTRLKQVQKGMAFCFLIARSKIVDGQSITMPHTVDETYGSDGVEGGYWNRGVQGTSGRGHEPIMPRVPPQVLAEDLQLALAGHRTSHIEQQQWEWMRTGLLDWIASDERLDRLARERAPGLFMVDDDPRRWPVL